MRHGALAQVSRSRSRLQLSRCGVSHSFHLSVLKPRTGPNARLDGLFCSFDAVTAHFCRISPGGVLVWKLASWLIHNIVTLIEKVHPATSNRMAGKQKLR
eukprot:s2644_g12.t1